MIKKITTLLLASVFITSIAQAKHHDAGGYMENNKKAVMMQKGGFKGPDIELTTVQNALEMKDDTRVHLKGTIEKKLDSDQYLFKDDTGTIEVEIDDKRWMGQTVTPNDTVEIYGKIDKDMLSKPEIDVKRITIVK